MKTTFWVFAVVSIIVGLLISLVSLVAEGLGLIWTDFGIIVCRVGVLSVAVGIVGMILGIISLRKGRGKAAVVFALLGLIFSGIVYVGMMADEMLAVTAREREYDREMEELYGKDWDSPSAIKGIPELYETLLNKFYAAVRDRWSAEKLAEFGAVSMPDYYGDASLDNIGFALMDLNGDDIDELVIGTTASAEGEATAVFCVYANINYPAYEIASLEGEVYYLHSGEGAGTYEAETVGQDTVIVIGPAIPGGLFDSTTRTGTLDSVGRLTLEMIPFSQYK